MALSIFTISTMVAAENCYLELTLNGEAIEGEPTVTTMGGVDVSSAIECLAFTHDVFRSGAHPTHKPILITKRVDKSTPLLYKGLFQNQAGEATIRFFRKNTSTGETEHFQTITLSNLRIGSVRRWQPSTLDPVGAQQPLLEEVTLLYQEITIEDVLSGTAVTATVN